MRKPRSLSLSEIGKRAEEDLHQAGGRFGDAVDQSDHRGAHTQDVGQKEGDEIQQHLRRDVVEQGGGRGTVREDHLGDLARAQAIVKQLGGLQVHLAVVASSLNGLLVQALQLHSKDRRLELCQHSVSLQ